MLHRTDTQTQPHVHARTHTLVGLEFWSWGSGECGWVCVLIGVYAVLRDVLLGAHSNTYTFTTQPSGVVSV